MALVTWLDWALLVVYAITFSCATYIIMAHRKYFQERIKKGVVSAFMLSMLFFLTAYAAKIGVGVWIYVSALMGLRTTDVAEFQLFLWLLASIGTMISLTTLAYQTYNKRYDLWFYLRRTVDRKDERK